MKKILMATDLSARSDRALQRAVMLADEFAAELKFLHVVDEALLEAITLQHEAAARTALAAQISALPLSKRVNISQDIIRGFDYCDISMRAADFGADLIVLGIHRHKSRELFRGTTAERVIRYGDRPVLVVKDPPLKPYRRILIGVDRSEHSVAAMALAARIAPQGEVFLLHVAHRPFSAFLGRDTQNQLIRAQWDLISNETKAIADRLSTELGNAAPKFELLLKEGEAQQVIRSQVTAIKPDLLAVGTHGRTGFAHAIIGSIAEDLLADAPVDVLAVKGR